MKMEEISARFSEKLKELPVASNSALMSKNKYDSLVSQVKNVKKLGKKVPSDFWLLKHYDVVEVRGVDKLIFPKCNSEDPVRYYVTEDELCDILYNIHCSIGHGGRDRMVQEAKKHYKNVTQQQISLFLQCCEACQGRKNSIRKGATIKPMENYNSRCQVDLIDMQSQPDESNKFIFVYQDYLTKFVVLRPLTCKKADEVASNLVDVFTTFGAPCVLQSDSGRDFCDSIIESLKLIWPELHIVHGESRQKPSQERTAQDVEKMVFAWMSDKNTTKWSECLRFVQFMRNKAFHSGLNKSPYEAMFGHPPKFGILNCALSEKLLRSLTTEEDLENIVKLDEFERKNFLKCAACQTEIDTSTQSSSTGKMECDLCKKLSRKRAREESVACPEQQASKMKKQSDTNFLDPWRHCPRPGARQRLERG